MCGGPMAIPVVRAESSPEPQSSPAAATSGATSTVRCALPPGPSAPATLPAAKRPRLEEAEDAGGTGGCADSNVVVTLGGSTGTASGMLRKMQEMLELCDVALVVREEDGSEARLRAHRLVLAAASNELRAMLLGGFREGSQEEVVLKDVPAWAARSLIEFIYAGRAAVCAERLLEMARVADFVGLVELRSQCVARAVQSLKVSNAADMLVSADSMGLGDLKQRAVETILADFARVQKTPGFLRLTRTLLEEILPRDDLRVRLEEEVFDGLMQWLKADQERPLFAEALLSCIRFPNMSPQYLLMKVATEPLLKACRCLPDLLDEAKNHMLLSLSSAQFQHSSCGQLEQKRQCPRSRPRVEYGDILLEGPLPGEPQADCMGVYELQEDMVHGRHVYQQQGETDLYLYYAGDKWYISDGEDMKQGRPRGWCQVPSQARTPEQITEEWTVWDSAQRSWEAAPRIKARQVNDAIRRELAARQQVQEAEARRQAQQVGDIVITGQQVGELQADCMGTYELQEQVVNGRPVYRQQGGADMFLFYASRGSKWCISDGEDMWAGRPKGWCYVVSQALTPDQITEQWEVVADDGGQEAYWQPAPRFKVEPRNSKPVP